MWKNVKKKAADASAKTIIGSKNTKEAISIQKKQHMIVERKKNFGVEYMDLLLQQQKQQQQEGDTTTAIVTEDDLQACVDRALEDINVLQAKLAKYQGRIAINQQTLDLKLSTSEKHTQPSLEVTDSVDSQIGGGGASATTTSSQHSTGDHPEPSAPPGPAAASATNPFDEEDDAAAFSAKWASTIAATSNNPFGEDEDSAAIANNNNNNPFDEDTTPSTTRSSRSLNTTTTRNANASTNPFEEEAVVGNSNVDPIVEATPAAPSTNPFGDDPNVVVARAEVLDKDADC